MERDNREEPSLSEVEELDADEKYVLETEGEWEGDEYVPSLDDDDMFSDEDKDFDEYDEDFDDEDEYY